MTAKDYFERDTERETFTVFLPDLPSFSCDVVGGLPGSQGLRGRSYPRCLRTR